MNNTAGIGPKRDFPGNGDQKGSDEIPPNQKPLPVRPAATLSDGSNASPTIGKRSSYRASSDSTVSSPDSSLRSSRSRERRTGLATLFSKKSPRSNGDDSDSDTTTQAASSGLARSPRWGSVRSTSGSSGAVVSRRSSLNWNKPPKATVAPDEIRCFFAVKQMGANNEDMLDVVLNHIHRLGRILSQVWSDPDRGMKTFDVEMKLLEDSILPQFSKAISQNQSEAIEDPVDEKSNDLLRARSMFARKPVDLKGHKDTLDIALYHIHGLGRELLQAWTSSNTDLSGFKKQREMFDQSLRPRLESALYQRVEVAKILPCGDRIESDCLGAVEKLLQERVFLDFSQFIHSQANRKKLQEVIPGIDELLKEMDLLENPGKTGAFSTIKLKISRTDSSEESSIEGVDKLGNDYALLVCAYQICEKYRSAVDEICRGLLQPDLLREEPSSIGIVNAIVDLVNEHASSPWATMNSSQESVMKGWLQKIHDKLAYRYLPVFVRGMMDNYRQLLVCNVKNRPMKSITLTSFDRFAEKLWTLLANYELSAPIDVARALKLEDHVRCSFNGRGVEIADDPVTPVKRFKVYLNTMSEAFGHPGMFWFLAKEGGFIPKGTQDLLSCYPGAYTKLMNLDTVQTATLRAKFERHYPVEIFEKALKYFKVSQNLLGQQVLYFFNHNLVDIRREKFQLTRLGIKKPDEHSNVRKNEYQIDVAGSRCKVTVIRHDGVIDPRVILRQEYTFSFDVDEDRIFTPSPDDVFLSIECPRDLAEDEEIQTMLFQLSLIMESLGLRPLQVKYI